MEFINKKMSFIFFLLLLVPIITLTMDNDPNKLIPLPKTNPRPESRFQVFPELKLQPKNEHANEHVYDNITKQASDQKNIAPGIRRYENVNQQTKTAITNNPSLRFIQSAPSTSLEGQIHKIPRNSNVNPFNLIKSPNDIIIDLVNESGINLEITLKPGKIAKAYGKAENLKNSDEKLLIVIPENQMYLSVAEPGTSTYGTVILTDQIQNLKSGQTITLFYNSTGKLIYKVK